MDGNVIIVVTLLLVIVCMIYCLKIVDDSDLANVKVVD